jgi:hypothetical protein
MRTAKFLFWSGIVIMTVGFVANGYELVMAVRHHLLNLNLAVYVQMTLNPLSGGGFLIGLAKVIEILHGKKNSTADSNRL